MNKQILYRFFEGTTSLEEEKQIREWMEASPDNERTFLKERKMFDAMLLLGNEKKRKEITEKKNTKTPKLIREFIKIAAVIALTLGAATIYQTHESSTGEPLMQTVSVPAGQRVNITLPDGTAVWLNARTSISYPVNFNKKNRQVILNGEAYFEVAKEVNSPFLVQTNACNVEVLGTHFNVDAYADSNIFETSLLEGSVRVTPINDSSRSIILKPNTKAYLEDGKLKIAQIEDFDTYRWREGLLCFKNASFNTIMHAFEKYYGTRFEINNDQINSYKYNGKFRLADGVDYALRVLQKDIRFSYTRDDEQQIVYIK